MEASLILVVLKHSMGSELGFETCGIGLFSHNCNLNPQK